MSNFSSFGYQYTRPQQRKLKLLKSREDRETGCAKASLRKTKELVNHELPLLVPEKTKERYTKGINILGLCLLIIAVIVFISNVLVQYDTVLHTSYLSVDELSGLCKPVPKINNFDLSFDTKGNWQTGADWEPMYSIWTMKVNGFQANQTTYEAWAKSTLKLIHNYKDAAANWTLMELYVWMTTFFAFYNNKAYKDYGDQYSIIFKSDVLPSIMFDGAVNYQNYYVLKNANSTATALCERGLKPDVTKIGSLVTISWPEGYSTDKYGNLYEKWECSKILNPITFLDLPRYRHSNQVDGSIYSPSHNATEDTVNSKIYDKYTLEIDMTSLFVCMSVNLRLMTFSFLIPVPTSPIFNIPYKIYKHPSYPDMAPIMCNFDAFEVDSIGGGKEKIPLCFLLFGMKTGSYSFGLPSVTSINFNPTIDGDNPKECTCPQTAENLEKCNKPVFQHLIYGMSFNKTIIVTEAIPTNFFDDYNNFNKRAVETLTSVVKSFGFKSSPLFNKVKTDIDYASFSKAVFNTDNNYDISKPDFGVLSDNIPDVEPNQFNAKQFAINNQYIVGFKSFGFSNAVSKYQVEAKSSCIEKKDFPTPFLDEDAQAKFMKTPPLELVESYYNCTKTPFQAFTVAIGLSVGLTNSILLVFNLIALPLLIYMLVKAGYMEENENVKHAYSEGERKDANKNFMDFLLSLRDDDAYSKTTDSNGDVNIGNKLVLDFLNFTRLRNKKEMEDFGLPVDEVLGTKNKNPLAFLDETNFRVETKDNTEDQADNKDVEGGAAGVGIEMKSNPMHK
jgi:hypothetical protein